MKIFVHPARNPHHIAYTVESRDIYSPNDNGGTYLAATEWDVYYQDHFGCIAQGFGSPDSALEWLVNTNSTELFVWKNSLTTAIFEDDKFLVVESATDGKVK